MSLSLWNNFVRDPFFDDFMSLMPSGGTGSSAMVPFNNTGFGHADLSETDKNYIVKVDCPGVAPQSMEVTYSDGMLTVCGERKHEAEDKNTQYHRVERSYGKFTRSFRLPNLEESKIKADHKDGVLTITCEKPHAAEKAKKSKISITSGGGGGGGNMDGNMSGSDTGSGCGTGFGATGSQTSGKK